MRNHGIACVHRDETHWDFSCASSNGYRFNSVEAYDNTEAGILQLITAINKNLQQMEVDTSRVVLVDSLPKVDSIFYKLADSFTFPLVVDPARLKLHEKRLGKTFTNIAELGAEAAITSWATEILLIETTNVCTFKCLYCPQDIMQRKKERLPLSAVKKIIEEYSYSAIGTLGFHVMGEPTANPDLPQIIEHAAKLRIGHALITNASILSRKTAEDLFRRGLHHIILSVQTFTKEQHNEVKRPAPKYSYETIMRNVRDIILAKWAVAPDARLEIHVMDNSIYRPRGVNIVANNNDAQEVISFWQDFVLKAASEFGNTAVVSKLPNNGPIDFSQITWPLGEYALAPMIFLNFKKAGHWIQDFTSDNEYIIPANKGICRAVTRNFTQHRQLGILSNGNTVMCCYDYDGQTTFGNIYETALSSIDEKAVLNRQQLVEKTNGVPFTVCKKCMGFRIRGFDNNFSTRKEEETITIKRAGIYYDTDFGALNLMQRLVDAGIKVIAFIERPNPTLSLAKENKSREGIEICSFEHAPEDTEIILFCPEWTYDKAVVEKMKKQYPHLLIGQVDLVALDPFKPVPTCTDQENKLKTARQREHQLEKEIALLRDEKKALQQKINNSVLTRIARTIKKYR